MSDPDPAHPDEAAFDAWLRAAMRDAEPADTAFTARVVAALPPRRSPWPEALILGAATAAGMAIAALALPPDLVVALPMPKSSPTLDSLPGLVVTSFALGWAVLALVNGRR